MSTNVELASAPASPSTPVYRHMIALDMEKSTLRRNPEKRELRKITYRILREALERTGIGDAHRERFTDRGDGVLVLVRAADEVPKTRLLGRFVPILQRLVDEYNERPATPGCPLRLRLVVHAGEVHDDGEGFFGQELDAAFRLLDAPKVKRCLAAGDAGLVVVVSDEIFRSVVSQRYEGVDVGVCRRKVQVRVADRRRQGWIYEPHAAERASRLPAGMTSAARRVIRRAADADRAMRSPARRRPLSGGRRLG